MYVNLSLRTECVEKGASNRLLASLVLILLTSLIFTISALNGSAQTSQTIVSGTVKDQNGALVAGATITLIDARTKAERTATTNDDGFYLFANILAGDYRIAAEGASRVQPLDRSQTRLILGSFSLRSSSIFENNCVCPIDRRRFLNTILANGECGCRGEDGNQSRLNASANLERPVQKPAFRFLDTKGTKT